MKLDILAVGSHPDDVELGCSGTLIAEIKRNLAPRLRPNYFVLTHRREVLAPLDEIEVAMERDFSKDPTILN